MARSSSLSPLLALRRAMATIVPAFTGVSFVEFWLPDGDTRRPDVSKLVRRGTMFALGNGKSVTAQGNGNAAIRVYAAYHRELADGKKTGKRRQPPFGQ